MTNEEIANELQGINGLLMKVEGLLHHCFAEKVHTDHLHNVLYHVREARHLIVKETQLFEPPLPIEPPSRAK